MEEAANSETSASILSLSLWVVKTVNYVESTLHVPFLHLILEVALVFWIIRWMTTKSYRPKETRLELSKEEEERLIAEWQPEPLIPEDVKVPHYVSEPKYIEGKPGYKITIDGKECLNLCTLNFLGLVGNKEIEDCTVKALRKYGVGACGPRAFYGTVDAHLTLEEKIASYLGMEEAILYSYGFCTVSSVIPAYSKRTDVIFCDSGVSFAIQKGISASRSKVYWFNHNDMDDLESKLKKQGEKDAKNPKKAEVTRRFLVVEGIYMNYGDIAPLPKIIELKNRFKVRVFIDETISFGVLGSHGRGVTEHFGIPLSEIDLMAVSMEASLGSVGGFCAGSSFIVDHQRLSGQGYAYSASLPPLLSVAAESGLKIMEQNNDMFGKLKNNAALFRKELECIEGMVVEGDEISPIIHLRFEERNEIMTRQEEEDKLESIVDECMEKGVGLTLSRYLNDLELFLPKASIRVAVNINLTEEDIKSSGQCIKNVVHSLLVE